MSQTASETYKEILRWSKRERERERERERVRERERGRERENMAKIPTKLLSCKMNPIIKKQILAYIPAIQKYPHDKVYKMNSVLGHGSALKGYIELGTTWTNEMKFVMSLVQDRSHYLLTSSPTR